MSYPYRLPILLSGLGLAAGLLLSTAGCAEEPRERHRILSFGTEFDSAASYFGTSPDVDRGLLWFNSGWSHPVDGQVWGVGARSTIQLWLGKRDHELILRMQTAPDLVKREQKVSVALNGTPIGNFQLEDSWAQSEFAFPLPESMAREGLNEISLEATAYHSGDEGLYGSDLRQHSVRLLELSVFAKLTAQEAERYGAPPKESSGTWEFGPVEERRSVATLSSQTPDVLVILLDAARPDHFGCYGYDRDTTPFIDALAADAVVFGEVFSTASYTRSAVPSLLTGLSWKEHGVVGSRDVLADSFVTMAEVFATAGYHTLGISGNANVSTGTGASQGFEDWTDIWSHPRYAIDNRFRLPVDLLEEKLDAGLGSRPVFGYLHLIPPHEPYEPGPEHDLWPTGDHSDWIDGSVECLKRLLAMKGRWRAEDLDRLISLYDGNLHFADSLVREVVEAWQAKRERPLHLVITSDHGEAMGEHGFVGHNTTVYDSMTRIPLIAWPATAFGAWSQDADQLLAISDIFPLLVSNEDVSLPAEMVWPGHFRNVLARDHEPRPAILLRNTGTQYGLRTSHSLLFTNGWDEQVLLEFPSGEPELRRAQEHKYRELANDLSAALRERSAPPANLQELSEEEVEALKALGYM